MPTLNWIGKDKVISHHQDVPYRVLEHKYGFTAENGEQQKPTNSGNKIIHGDNLEALKSLLPEYEGRINAIYIDPPYNTGNEGWQYNDNVNHPKIKKWLGETVGQEGDDLTRHDKWLCMMYPRLMLLNKLLSKEGIIFISIDDNEQANLKSIMDEIFGRKNFITTLHVEMSSVQGQKVKFAKQGNIVKNGEYILVYRKNGNKAIAKNILYNKQDYDTHYSLFIKKISDDTFQEVSLSSHIIENEKEILEHLLNLKLAKEKKGNYTLSNKNIAKAYSVSEVFRNFIHKNADFIVADDKVSSLSGLEDLELEQGIVKKIYKSSRSYLLTKNSNNNIRQRLILGEKVNNANDFNSTYGLTTIRGDWWSGYYKDMGNVAKEANTKFDNAKKPKRLIRDLLYMSTNNDDIILDSFAGSGTTAHSVIDLNAEDKGKRQFILIELEEYANKITAERVKRVIDGYNKGEEVIKNSNGKFDFYELGLPLFDENQNLNEQVGINKIREYIWFSETRTPFTEPKETNYFLGKKEESVYYFIYEKDQLTTLDFDALQLINCKGEQYVIYADNCLLPKEFMAKNNIIFKKIPRDITRF